MINFADLAAQASAGPDVIAYLKARGIDRTATLALIASTDDAYIRADPFVKPLVAQPTRQRTVRAISPGPSCYTCGWKPNVSGRSTSLAYIVYADAHADAGYYNTHEQGGREAAQALLCMGPVCGGLQRQAP